VAETIVPGSPEAWREKLLVQLSQQAQRVGRLERYYNGDHPIPKPPEALDPQVFKEACRAHRTIAQMGVTNFTRLIADAPANRLQVVGFQFTAPGTGEDSERDAQAWEAWQRSHLDADQGLVYTMACSTGQAYGLVWGDGDRATITIEHPSQMIVAYESGSRRRRAAALKCWQDDDGKKAVLYLPIGIYKWRMAVKANSSEAQGWERWQPDTDTAWPVDNELGVVPVVEFRANPPAVPMPYGGGRSEFEPVLPVQDRINKTQFDRLVTAEFQAFRQRYTIGWQPPTDAEGNPDAMATYKASVARLQNFFSEDPDLNREIKVGEFAQADFSGFLKAVEADIQQMAAITETPAYYLLGQMVNISSDALIAAEAGLIAKTERHQDNFSETWEELIRLALQAEGDPGANDVQAETLWGDVEQRTWGQTVDAAAKVKELEVPIEAVWEMLPTSSPQKIARWRAQRAGENLFATPSSDATSAAAELKAKADALGALIRSGVDPEDAAQRVGLTGLVFTGAVPVSLRLPESDAAALEE